MLCAVHPLIWDRRERPAPPGRVEYSLVLAMATLAHALDGLVARDTTGHCRGGRVLLGAPSLDHGYATKLFAQYYSSSDHKTALNETAKKRKKVKRDPEQKASCSITRGCHATPKPQC